MLSLGIAEAAVTQGQSGKMATLSQRFSEILFAPITDGAVVDKELSPNLPQDWRHRFELISGQRIQ